MYLKKMINYLFLFVFFFFFSINKVNTIDSVALIHNNRDIDEEKYYSINFYNFNIRDLQIAFKDLDIEILNIKPMNCEIIYFTSIEQVINDYNKFLMNDENLYLNNFYIESMKIISSKKNLLSLEKRIDII